MFTLLLLIGGVLLLACLVGLIVLQVSLSKRDSWGWGLLLPAISLAFSIVAAGALILLSVFRYTTDVSIHSESSYITESGETIIVGDGGDSFVDYGSGALPVDDGSSDQSSDLGVSVLGVILVASALNLPTVVYLIIYACIRSGIKRRKRAELDKMTIQDLA